MTSRTSKGVRVSVGITPNNSSGSNRGATGARVLANAAKLAQSDAVDMYRFTSILKTEMEENERLALIEDLWEMVYADGEIHEFEDNVVWRVAELIGIQSRERMVLKQRVLNRRDTEAVGSGV